MNKTSELESYRTTNVLALVLLILFLVTKRPEFLLIGIWLLIVNIVHVEINQVLSFYWLRFAEILGKINSKILLFLIFAFILTPLAFFYRLFHPKELRKFTVDDKQSYFEDVNKLVSKEDFPKQW
ncbi:MAG: hypothetical protein WC884_03800 [Candidatus Paceibacterota bacterium]